MYDFKATCESNVSQERAVRMRDEINRYVNCLSLRRSCRDIDDFLSKCLVYAATRCGCMPEFITVRRYFEGSSTCKCIDFYVYESRRAVLTALFSSAMYLGEIVDVGFETDQDSFWIHLTGGGHDVF